MAKQVFVMLAIGGVAAGLLVLCSNLAQAQSGGQGSVQAPLHTPRSRAPDTNPVPPGGPQHSKMPLAREDQFRDAEKRAPNSVPEGTPGVSR